MRELLEIQLAAAEDWRMEVSAEAAVKTGSLLAEKESVVVERASQSALGTGTLAGLDSIVGSLA